MVLARNVLGLARNTLVEARFAAIESWSGMGARGDWTCKLMWAAGLGGKMGLGGAAARWRHLMTARAE